MASTYLTRTPSSAGNRKTFTYSSWIKKSSDSTATSAIGLSAGNTSGGTRTEYSFVSNKIRIGFNPTGSAWIELLSVPVYRDTSAWYHNVLAVDTTQATASDRVKLYINGLQVSLTGSYPSQNTDLPINNNIRHTIGCYSAELNQIFDGSMSHVHFIDGTAYDASYFGSTDATTGEWKINTSPSVTYGTNGFFILKDGNSVTDQSGNSNNFTVGGGTLTNTEDNPSNVFAVGNRLIPSLTTYTNGNLTISNGASWKASGSTLAVTQGKYYAEMKVDSLGGVGATLGVEDMDLVSTWSAVLVGTSVNGRGYYYDGNVYNNGNASAFGATFTTGDIIGIALDMDNKFVYFSKNGVFQNSGDPTSGSSGTGGLSLAGTTYCFAYAVYSSTVSLNFGNGYFGTSAVSSAGTNASGNGIFEYDVPTGYTALSTKGLNL